MRKVLAVFGCFLVCGALPLFSQTLDTTIATVRLIRLEAITVSQLQAQVGPLETQAGHPLSADEKSQVVDQLVQRALIEQAAERDKVSASAAAITQRFNEYRTTFANTLNLGRDLTDTEMQNAVTATGFSWDAFQDRVRYEVLRLAYVKARKPAVLAAVQDPTDADAADYYDYHKKDFVTDDMVRLKHIFVDTRGITTDADRATARARAETILAEIKAGSPFDDAQMKYSDDVLAKYEGGDLGIIDRLDQKKQQQLGKSFLDAVFALQKGEMSDVIPSNIGFHIVVVTDKFDAALLGLFQLIPPTFQSTVNDFIKQNLAAQRQTDAIAKALEEITTELKAQAEIQILSDNFSG